MVTAASDRSVLVVGAGLAGARTVAALRAGGHRGKLTVLGAEGVLPYDRPPLSKELFTRTEPVWLAEEFDIDLAVLADEVRLDDPATRLAHTDAGWHVSTPGGGIEADDVVLATGSVPHRPWPDAVVLHTAADAARLRPRLQGGRVVVIGAGWIGAEIAGIAAGIGTGVGSDAEVTVIEANPAPLARQLGATVGAHLAPWFPAAGVQLRTGVGVTGIRSTSPGTRVDLDDGTFLDADVVLAAVGARPATRWLSGTIALSPSGAIQTDGNGRVIGGPAAAFDATGLWAVGDCATRTHPGFGLVPGGHWSAALHDPESTAHAILNDAGIDAGPEPAHHAPYVFSRQLGHDLALFGLPRAGNEVVFRGDPSGASGWTALYLDATLDGGSAMLQAVLAIDNPRDASAARRLLRQGPLLIDREAAQDPAAALRAAGPATRPSPPRVR